MLAIQDQTGEQQEQPGHVQDQWAAWLLEKRHGGDQQRLAMVLNYLYPVRDKILANARLTGGETLLDIGCGDGLLSFGALDKLPQGKVVFSDISQDLLNHVQQLVNSMGAAVTERCDFLRASADDLSALADESVDVVTMRSVLIYVKDKQQAMREFFRVLKPGGRLSLFEPVMRYDYPEAAHTLWGYDVSPVQAIAQKVKARYLEVQPMDDPMFNFDERDMLRWADALDFYEVDAEYQMKICPVRNGGLPWEAFLQVAPNPVVPSLGEVFKQALTVEEQAALTAVMRPLVETDQGRYRHGILYLWATKHQAS